MRVLVTGGTGFLGRALCSALIRRGYDVAVLSRTPSAVRVRCHAAARGVSSLREAGPVDAVFNLAGAPILDARWTGARKALLRNSRVAFTEALVRQIAEANPKPAVLLSGSAVGYYGDTGDTEFDETQPAGDDFASQLCADWESAAACATGFGIRVCLLRTGLVLHPTGGLLARLTGPFRLGIGGRLGNGRQSMSWIHLDDWIALALRLASDTDAIGPFNLTTPSPVTNAEFTTALGRALSRPTRLPVPAFALRLLLGERASMLLGGQRALPRKAEQRGHRFCYPTLTAALADLRATAWTATSE